ncbi:DUF3085 domain-containing protein [Cupriavidus pauculus]|uniref:DUF3085 domain-containing protein n=1 Tax=Cupriavidus pauculus TaxID=82633 RepID=UPI001EE18A74|nr:DUF3085 domain-containing protein [Cupriavidus pauculus]GJG97742.1 DUF3085 domain-containing protein [Cupriavidus pauculus]
MPELFLNRQELERLVAFCTNAKADQFLVAKDRGAYVGYRFGNTLAQQCMYYFCGCNPEVDADYDRNARVAFGGGDFVERLPLSYLQNALADLACERLRIAVTADAIRLTHLYS